MRAELLKKIAYLVAGLSTEELFALSSSLEERTISARQPARIAEQALDKVVERTRERIAWLLEKEGHIGLAKMAREEPL